jgi:hypothetical protein
LFLALLAAVLSSTATAQTDLSREDLDSPGLVIEAIAGWGGIVDPSTPVPMSFLLRNDSDRNIEGILTLTEITNGQEVTLGEVFITPGTTRRFTSIQSMTNWFTCLAKLSHNGKILWRRQLDLVTGRTVH